MITSNVAEFSGRIIRAAEELTVGSKAGVTAAAAAYTTSIRAEIGRDTHGTNRLRGVGRRGAAVGAGYDVRVDPRGPSALVKARGPLHLLENDTRAHSMTAKRGARGRANRSKRAVMTVGRGHPGTKGKHPFLRGEVAATPAAVEILRRAVGDSVKAVFR